MDSLSRLGQRISENINESTRNLTFAGSARDLFETTEDQRKHILKLLESSHDREKIEGMKRLIALISKAHPVASFFPHVIKLVSTPTLELRKLIYIYILRHAESEPDLALLCINTFQKDLNDPNPLIRSMAIRVLSGIRVPMVGGIVELAVKKGASDPNPHVRKAAALAIPKLYGTDNAHYATLLPILTALLADSSPIPLGAAVTAFLELCPHRLDALHPHFRRYCALLVEADEWTQLVLMDVLGQYARTMLERPPTGGDADDDDDDEPDEDLVLLLSATGALLYSPSPAVVLAVARLHHLLSPPPPTPLPHLAPPLLKLFHHPDSGVRLAVVRSCAQLARERPDVFDDETEGEGRWKAFLLGGVEGGTEAQAKIEVLQELVSTSNVRQVVEELVFYERNPLEQISSAAVVALGSCARRRPEIRDQVTSALLKLLKRGRDSTITAAILVLQDLILLQATDQASAQSAAALVTRLASKLEGIKSPSARACVLGLVGRYPGEGGLVGLEILRLGVRGFAREQPEVKLALLTLATKLFALPTVQVPDQLRLLGRHLFLLARYDNSYDVRDRARFLRGLVRGLLDDGPAGDEDAEDGSRDIGGVVLRQEQISLVIGGGHQPVAAPSSKQLPVAEFGTASALVRPHFLPSYTPLPDWKEEGTDSALRDPPPSMEVPSYAPSAPSGPSKLQGFGSESFGASGGAGGSRPAPASALSSSQRRGEVNLDKFYESSSEEEESDEDESEDESEEESSEDDDEETDSDQGSDEADRLVRRPRPAEDGDDVGSADGAQIGATGASPWR